MVLPEYIKIEEINPIFREAVMNINRIRGVSTLSNGIAEIWEDLPIHPVKEGFFHFYVEGSVQPDLIKLIDAFCKSQGFFELEGPNRTREGVDLYTIIGHFAPLPEEYPLFISEMDTIKRKSYDAYIESAHNRVREMESGWKRLNEVISDYIRTHIMLDFENLPYRGKTSEAGKKVQMSCFRLT